MGPMAWAQPNNNGDPPFLEAFQNGQNVTAFGALGTPCLAIFRWYGFPSFQGEATYNQWAFKVCSFKPWYQEEVLQQGIIQSLKSDTANMVWFLGPAPSIKAIPDKLDSLYGSVSTFDVMMQGFYRESQGRSKSIGHCVMRLKGKLNEILVKHPNRVSEVELPDIFGIVCVMALGNPQEVIHAKFDNSLNDYMALMRAARKAEGEHGLEKHNTSCTYKSGVVSEGPSNQEGSANPDSEAPTQEPWSKWGEMQQHLMAAIKGAQNTPKKSP